MTNETNNASSAQAWDAITARASGVVQITIGRDSDKAKFKSKLVQIDLSTLPDDAIAFALHYGLKQYIADGTAGSADQGGFDVGVEQRVKKLKEADFRRASGERGPKQDTPESLALKNATAALRKRLAAAGQKADASAIKAAAQKAVEANPKWVADAKKELAERAKLIDSLDLGDILGDLLGMTDNEEEAEIEA